MIVAADITRVSRERNIMLMGFGVGVLIGPNHSTRAPIWIRSCAGIDVGILAPPRVDSPQEYPPQVRHPKSGGIGVTPARRDCLATGRRKFGEKLDVATLFDTLRAAKVI